MDCFTYVKITNPFKIKSRGYIHSNQVIDYFPELIRTTLYTKYFISSCFLQKTNSHSFTVEKLHIKIFYNSLYIRL